MNILNSEHIIGYEITMPSQIIKIVLEILSIILKVL
jgi:hypothetical protein